MSVNWEKFQEDARKEAEKLEADVVREVQEVEDYYKGLTAHAQEAAIEARDEDVGPGETPAEYDARIASLTGSFSDRAESAKEVVDGPKIQAAIAVSQSPIVEPDPQQVAVSEPVTEPVQEPVETPAPVVEDAEVVEPIVEEPVEEEKTEDAPEDFSKAEETPEV